MLLVIFGAGASYDSVLGPPPAPSPVTAGSYFRPPLATQLFDRRPNFERVLHPRFSKAAPLVDDARRTVIRRQNLEALLDRYVTLGETSDRARRELLAVQFYLQQTLAECGSQWLDQHAGVTHYRSFLDLLDREHGEPVLLVTFNYDLLLDDACVSVLGWNLSSFDQYVAEEDFKLFKVHGSVDWGHRVEFARDGIDYPDGLEMRLISAAPSLVPGRQFEFFRSRHDVYVDELHARVPALAVPVASKWAFECPDDHLNVLRAALPEVRSLLVIGWRAGEMHFLDILKKLRRSTPVTIVSSGTERARETAAALHETVGLTEFYMRPDPESPRIVEPGFSGLIELSWLAGRIDYERQ